MRLYVYTMSDERQDKTKGGGRAYIRNVFSKGRDLAKVIHGCVCERERNVGARSDSLTLFLTSLGSLAVSE